MLRFLILAGLIAIMVVCLGVGASTALAVNGPIHPGNVLFPIQHTTEQIYALRYPQQTDRAQYYLRLVDRRIDDVTLVPDGSAKILALHYHGGKPEPGNQPD